MADGKWIAGLSPDTPVEVAAGLVLAARLEVVTRMLPLALQAAAKDIEHVHQLRVSTRRAGAALRIFRPLLPKKRFQAVRETLRTIRRAAGDARDWDVFLVLLGDSPSLKPPGCAPASDLLTGYAVGQRMLAQEKLHGLEPLLAADPFPDVESLATKPADGEPATVSAMAVTVLGELFAELNARIDAKPTDAAALHQLRIAGKRVRYAMEVFAESFAPPFRETLYPAVERMQSILGTVQDCHVAVDRLTAVLHGVRASQPKVATRARPGVTALLKELRNSAQAQKRAFRSWVVEWRRLRKAHPLETLLLP